MIKNVTFRIRDRIIDLSDRAMVMGVVNRTIDSFSDGGKFLSCDDAVAHAQRLVAEGAGMIDVGGESTRPGAAPVDEATEKARVVPVIVRLAAESEVFLSVDTSKPGVARAALEAGADVINDITGFRDPAMLDVARDFGAGMIVMHMQGTPATMQAAPAYGDVVAEIRDFFRHTLDRVLSCGVDPEQVAFDPGIGFGKTLEHNLALLRVADSLQVGHRPLLMGVSRKSFIAQILGDSALDRRTAPTVGLTALLRAQGVRLFRVHDVRENVDALRVVEAVLAGRGATP